MFILLFILVSSAFKAVSFSVKEEVNSCFAEVTKPSTLLISPCLSDTSLVIAASLASTFVLTGETTADILEST